MRDARSVRLRIWAALVVAVLLYWSAYSYVNTYLAEVGELAEARTARVGVAVTQPRVDGLPERRTLYESAFNQSSAPASGDLASVRRLLELSAASRDTLESGGVEAGRLLGEACGGVDGVGAALRAPFAGWGLEIDEVTYKTGGPPPLRPVTLSYCQVLAGHRASAVGQHMEALQSYYSAAAFGADLVHGTPETAMGGLGALQLSLRSAASSVAVAGFTAKELAQVEELLAPVIGPRMAVSDALEYEALQLARLILFERRLPAAAGVRLSPLVPVLAIALRSDRSAIAGLLELARSAELPRGEQVSAVERAAAAAWNPIVRRRVPSILWLLNAERAVAADQMLVKAVLEIEQFYTIRHTYPDTWVGKQVPSPIDYTYSRINGGLAYEIVERNGRAVVRGVRVSGH